MLDNSPLFSISDKSKIILSLKECLEYGSYPEVVISKDIYIKEKILGTYLEDFLDRYSKSVYSRRMWNKKIYVVDVGLSTYLGFDESLGRKM